MIIIYQKHSTEKRSFPTKSIHARVYYMNNSTPPIKPTMDVNIPPLSEEEKLKALRDQTKKKVMTEIEEYKKTLPQGQTWHIYLNNFMRNLPNRAFTEGSETAHRAKKRGKENITIGQMEDDMDRHFGDPPGKSRDYAVHSERYYSKTAKQLLDDVFLAIKNTPEVSLDRIYELQEVQNEASDEYMKLFKGNDLDGPAGEENRIKMIKANNDLYDYTLPVYIELRVMGYMRADFTA